MNIKKISADVDIDLHGLQERLDEYTTINVDYDLLENKVWVDVRVRYPARNGRIETFVSRLLLTDADARNPQAVHTRIANALCKINRYIGQSITEQLNEALVGRLPDLLPTQAVIQIKGATPDERE
jgi:hypothetical protein